MLKQSRQTKLTMIKSAMEAIATSKQLTADAKERGLRSLRKAYLREATKER